MPIPTSSLPWRFTSAAATLGAGDAGSSLGGFASGTLWPDGSLHSLFPKITGKQNGVGWTDYRCVAVLNTHPSLTWSAVKLYLAKLDTRGAAVSIGLDGAGVVTVNATRVAQALASATTAPTNVTFSTPTTEAGGLAVPLNVAPGQGFAVWIRRTVLNAAEVDPESNLLLAAGSGPQ